MPFLLGLFSGIYFISLNVIGVSFTHYPGDLIDARFCNYLLEHAHLFFSGQLDSYWNAPFMFPESNVISYSDNLLGSFPFYSLFRYLGCERESAFQGWYLLVSVLNYSACYLFLFVVFKNHYSAVLGAMVFAFALSLHSQMGHAQTLARFPIPLTFLMAYLFLKELNPVYFFCTLLFWVYQLYCGIYLGFMLLIPVALIFIISLFFKWEDYKIQFQKIKWWAYLALALLINILLLLPLMLPYLERANSLGLYSYEHVSKTLLTPLSYFFSWNGSLLWDFLSAIGTHYEWYTNYQMFAGGIATLCMIIFVVIVFSMRFSKKSFSKFTLSAELQLFFLVGLFTFLFFIRFGDFSLYKILFYLPGFASMRALQRIINIELLFYAIAVSFIFTYLFRNKNTLSAILFACSLALIILDTYVQPDKIHHHEKAETRARVNPLIDKMKDLPKRTLISYEPDSIDSSINDFHLDAMLAAQSLNLISLNGYSSTSPNGYSAYWANPNVVNRLFWLNAKGLGHEKVYVIK